MTMQYTKLFEPAVLPITTPVTLLTVAASPSSTLLRGAIVRLTNTTAVSAVATLYAVPLAGAAGVANSFAFELSIGPKSYVDVQVPQMKAGDFLQGVAGTAASISIAAIAGSYYSA
jgi:hypothetical protein